MTALLTALLVAVLGVVALGYLAVGLLTFVLSLDEEGSK